MQIATPWPNLYPLFQIPSPLSPCIAIQMPHHLPTCYPYKSQASCRKKTVQTTCTVHQKAVQSIDANECFIDNIIMPSMYGKEDPVLLYQQQKSHYEHLYNPRATFQIDSNNRRTHSLYYRTKTNHEKERQRKIENKKMLVSLLDIYNGQGLLGKMEMQGAAKRESKTKSLISNYKRQQAEKSIQRGNRVLCYNIMHAEPTVGTKKGWSKHFEQHLEIEKKLTSIPNDQVNLEQIRNTLTQQKKRNFISQKSLEQQQIFEEAGLTRKERKKRKLGRKLKHNEKESLERQQDRSTNNNTALRVDKD